MAYNSLSYQRKQLVHVVVNIVDVKVVGPDGQTVRSQAMPVTEGRELSAAQFRVWFEVLVKFGKFLILQGGCSCTRGKRVSHQEGG